ncbi:DUF4232 domain-containing protein [Streptomyces sp. NRRL S-813]|uniref:DUF4232 domain-containing protein n=1 Tax=Streptomyces sp. NRRL S-813 TaxID=1463919 RepID=UPI0004BE85C3|nr:DUF4232 domain-containing protein [Streptomyces sp. NRRL S-813]
MTHRGAKAATVACCAALVAVLTGCTSAGTGGSPAMNDGGKPPVATGSGARNGATADPSNGSTPTPSTGSAAAESPAAPTPAESRCHSAELRASVGPNHPGAGQENFAVVLTNGSHRTCTVYGFPGLAFVDGTGQAVTPDPERTGGQDARVVTLAPGESAWSALSFTHPAVSGVTTVTPAALLVTPPGETASTRVRWSGGEVSNTGKASVPQVSPLRAGDGG